MAEVQIDVWADVVCPWCYIGKRRLEQAVAESAHPADVAVTYHAYELDPHVPRGDGQTVLQWLADRYGTDLDGAREIAERPATIGRPDGVDIEVDVNVVDTPLDDWQRWLREHVVERLPRWLQ